jgi:hypothetical protein
MSYLDVAVDGVPGIVRVSVFAWPEPPGHPNRVGIDIVRAGDYVLKTPITTGLDLTPSERPANPPHQEEIVITAEELEGELEDTRPAIIKYRESVWQLCATVTTAREVRALDTDGRPVFAEVNTKTHSYKLICPKCGRTRYAQRNCLKQIKYCHVCTIADRRRRRALAQYRRRQRTGPAKYLPPHKIEQAIELWQSGRYTQAEISRLVGLTPSGLGRLLQRHGVKP